MNAGSRVMACVLSLSTLFLPACSDKKTIIQGPAGGHLKNNGFPTSADAQGVTSEPDLLGDWGFYTGESPGRTDPYIDIQRIWTGHAQLEPVDVGRLEEEIPCGPGESSLVICNRPTLEPGISLLVTLGLAGDVPLENTSPEDSGRYSVFFDVPGDPDTRSEATPDGPDLASDGTNLVYQAILGTPGGATTQAEGEAVELIALDDRTGEFIDTSARVILKGSYVTFLIPLSELGETIHGLRGGAFWGNAADQGDPSLGNQDVVPGDVHAPYGLLEIDLPADLGQDPDAAAAYVAFLRNLEAAIAQGDPAFLEGSLHEAVRARYGDATCSSYLRGLQDPTRSYAYLGYYEFEPWDYTSDGLTTTITDALTLDVEATVDGQTSETEIHLAPGSDGKPAWFTDCGEPVM